MFIVRTSLETVAERASGTWSRTLKINLLMLNVFLQSMKVAIPNQNFLSVNARAALTRLKVRTCLVGILFSLLKDIIKRLLNLIVMTKTRLVTED